MTISRTILDISPRSAIRFRFLLKENEKKKDQNSDIDLKGFQLFIDAYNGFGGLASQSLNLVIEEFPKSAVLSFMLFPQQRQHVKLYL